MFWSKKGFLYIVSDKNCSWNLKGNETCPYLYNYVISTYKYSYAFIKGKRSKERHKNLILCLFFFWMFARIKIFFFFLQKYNIELAIILYKLSFVGQRWSGMRMTSRLPLKHLNSDTIKRSPMNTSKHQQPLGNNDVLISSCIHSALYPGQGRGGSGANPGYNGPGQE